MLRPHLYNRQEGVQKFVGDFVDTQAVAKEGLSVFKA
jgi:hypothetical protein